MKIFQKRLFPSAILKNVWSTITPFVLISSLMWITSCSDDDTSNSVATLEGKIVSYNEFGAAMLDFQEADMAKAGFSLGDVISITIDGQEIIMPYYDGFYASTGEYICVAYPTYPSICFTANNTGLPEELTGLEGHTVTVRMKDKGGCLDVQEALSMKYTDERANYPYLSDEQFANARMISTSNIANGVLYRSSSPFSNEIGRAYYVSDFLEREQVKTVLNLADTEENMLNYDMPPYSRTIWENDNVILCPLKADPTADDFNTRLIAALQELPLHPAPYVVHCTEGKDRTGYVCALLEGLCGATYEEMVADYLTTYYNYYYKSPDSNPEVCNTLVLLRLNPCLMYYAGVFDEAQLPNVDYQQAFSAFLLSHGMSHQQLDALIHALTTAPGL